MYIRLICFLLIVCSVMITIGCSILLTEQEWSDNYALLDGAHSTIPEMIDGDLTTVGKTLPPTGPGRLYGSSNATEVIITLPEKKFIRKIIINSENIKKFVLYADMGGTIHSDTDWQRVKESEIIKTNPIVIPYLYTSPVSKFRLVILGTSDDVTLSRQAKAQFMVEQDQNNRNGSQQNRSFQRRRNPARISEIEIYGYKSATETAATKSDPQPDVELVQGVELDSILK